MFKGAGEQQALAARLYASVTAGAEGNPSVFGGTTTTATQQNRSINAIQSDQ